MELRTKWTIIGRSSLPEGARINGWLTDKFGVSWQIVPTVLIELLSDPDAAKSQQVMKAMLQMGKIDIEQLQRASLQKA